MTMRHLAFLVLVACGGTVMSTGDGGDGGSSEANTIDAPGYTNCSAPSGDKICGGSNDCGQNGCTDPPPFNTSLCSPLSPPYDKLATVCTMQGVESGDCNLCGDGRVCILNPQSVDDPVKHGFFGLCANEDFVPLFEKAGESNRIWYADRSRYTGAPLPAPTMCPNVPGLPLCGGPCGMTCPANTKCSGRSPLHPFSLCIDTAANLMPLQTCTRSAPGCPKSKCMIYKDAPADQPLADANGLCVSTAACLAAAQSYPGGVDCL